MALPAPHDLELHDQLAPRERVGDDRLGARRAARELCGDALELKVGQRRELADERHEAVPAAAPRVEVERAARGHEHRRRRVAEGHVHRYGQRLHVEWKRSKVEAAHEGARHEEPHEHEARGCLAGALRIGLHRPTALVPVRVLAQDEEAAAVGVAAALHLDLLGVGELYARNRLGRESRSVALPLFLLARGGRPAQVELERRLERLVHGRHLAQVPHPHVDHLHWHPRARRLAQEPALRAPRRRPERRETAPVVAPCLGAATRAQQQEVPILVVRLERQRAISRHMPGARAPQAFTPPSARSSLCEAAAPWSSTGRARRQRSALRAPGKSLAPLPRSRPF